MRNYHILVYGSFDGYVDSSLYTSDKLENENRIILLEDENVRLENENIELQNQIENGTDLTEDDIAFIQNQIDENITKINENT